MSYQIDESLLKEILSMIDDKSIPVKTIVDIVVSHVGQENLEEVRKLIHQHLMSRYL